MFSLFVSLCQTQIYMCMQLLEAHTEEFVLLLPSQAQTVLFFRLKSCPRGQATWKRETHTTHIPVTV